MCKNGNASIRPVDADARAVAGGDLYLSPRAAALETPNESLSLICPSVPVQPVRVIRVFRPVVSNLIAALLLLTGSATTPDAVLCSGPGNHFHIETVLGTSCNARLQTRRASVPHLPDGCPEGSRDFRLNVDSHPSDSLSLLAEAGFIARVSHVRVAAALLLHPRVFVHVQRHYQSPPSIVLRP